jgi:hypothetical protein
METKHKGIGIKLPSYSNVLTNGIFFFNPYKYTTSNLLKTYAAAHHIVCKDLRQPQKHL